MTLRMLVFVLTMGLVLSVPAMAAQARKVTITDHIGVDWQDELVHETLTFGPGELKGLAVAGVSMNGKAIPCQVTDVARHADGSVASMKVWWMADVPAWKSASYEVRPKSPAGPMKAGVQIREREDGVELTTQAPQTVGIRLLGASREFLYPVPASEVPGPIQALLMPSGRVVGRGGRLAVPFKVKSYSSRVTARGPVFAEVEIKYLFDVGYWTFRARVLKGCPMIMIREELDTGYLDREYDQMDRFFTIRLNTGGFAPKQGWFTGRVNDPQFCDLAKQLHHDVWDRPGVARGRHATRTGVNGYTLRFKADRDDYYLNPFPTWSWRANNFYRAVEPGGEAIGLAPIDSVYWRNALALRVRTTEEGALELALPLQVYEQAWPAEGYGRFSPNATGKTLYVPDSTARRSYGIMLSSAEDEQEQKLRSLIGLSVKLGSHPLDEVRRWVLDWPDPMQDAGWAEQTSKEGELALEHVEGWIAMKRRLGHYGLHSMWNHRTMTHMRYGPIRKVIDSAEHLTAEDRKRLRQMCAYQAYVYNSLEHFGWGTGSHLGNPNMSIMAMDARIKSAELVKDHPQFKRWGEWTLHFTRDYIDRFTRESGAPYENVHYTMGVTIAGIADVNQRLMDYGIGDAMDTPRFHKCMRFVMDWLTPPDPRFNGHRVMAPFGNSSYQSVPPDVGRMLVEYYKARDPELASKLQWVTNQTLAEKWKGKEIRLDIVKSIRPELGSRWYEDYGVFMRHGFGTKHETYLMLFAGNCNGHYEWETDQMCYTLYAKGQPINLHFGNGYFPMFGRPWLRNRVSIDHRCEISERMDAETQAASFTPETEYARAQRAVDRLAARKPEYPPEYGSKIPDPPFPGPHEDIALIRWYRQIMFVKDADPKGPNYFVLRDAFGGTPEKPTDLSLWFLATKMERRGGVFHYEGQCEVDMDVFVAEPTEFEAETGEFQHRQQPYVRYTGFDPKYHPGGKRQEKQLFLRIAQPPGKGYLVVLYPRLKEGDPAAEFTRLGPNAVKVQTALSTDYVFMNPYRFGLEAEGIGFDGLAGAVRRYKDGRVTVTSNEGTARFTVDGKKISGTGAWVVTIQNGRVSTKTFGEDASVKVE